MRADKQSEIDQLSNGQDSNPRTSPPRSPPRGSRALAGTLAAASLLAVSAPGLAQPNEPPGTGTPEPGTPAPSEPAAPEPAPTPSGEGEAQSAPEPQPAPELAAEPESVPATTEPEPASGDVMIVTAQFRKQNPQKTPLALTVVGGEQIRERSQVSITDIAQAPNVKLSPSSGIFGPSLQAYIRGVGQADFNFAFEPGVGVYVDDVYYATLVGTAIDLLDLERVEILRGPQGTLTGQNSIGGALRMYSRKPQGGNTGFVDVGYGRYNRTDVRAAGDFTLVDRKLFARISGVGTQSDGYVTRYDYACSHPGSGVPTYQNDANCKLGTEGGRSYAGVRAALRWVPTNDVEITLSGDFTKDNSEATPATLLYVGSPAGPGLPEMPPPGPNLFAGPVPLGTPAGSAFISYSPYGSQWADDSYRNGPYSNYSTYSDPAPIDGSSPYSVPPVFRVDTGGTALKINVDLTDKLTLTGIGAYRQYSGDWSVEEGSPVGIYLLHNVVSNRQGTGELRLTGKLFRDYVDFTIGGFYLNQESTYTGRVSLRTAQLIEDDVIPAMTGAGFANVEGHITDKLDLVVGFRYTHQSKDFRYGRDFVDGAMVNPGIAAIDGTVGRFSGGRADYRGALQYQWLPSFMTYAQIATGFKGGGVNPRPFVPDQALPHNPETLIAYELGAKSEWFDRRLRFNAAGFFNQYSDILMTAAMCPQSVLPAPCFLPINAGEANVAGFELETVVRPIRGLEFDGSVGYLNFKYDSISADAASSGITKDMTAPYAPTWQASAGARYSIVMGSKGSLTPRLDLVYQDSFYTLPTNTSFSEVDSRLVLNGRLTWASSDDLWSTALEVTNITNQLYYLNVRDDRPSTYTVTGQPAPPIRWALSVRRNFL